MKKELIIIVLISLFLTFVFYAYKNTNFEKSKEKTKVQLTVEEELKLQKKLSDIVKQEDFSKCDAISNTSFKTSCINNIALNLAEKNLDISYCDKIDGKLVSKEYCLSKVLYQKSINDKNPFLCEKLNSENDKKACKTNFYLNFAFVDNGEWNKCSLEKDDNIRNICNSFFYIKKIKEDPENFKCNILLDENMKKDCENLKKYLQDKDRYTLDCNQYFSTDSFIKSCNAGILVNLTK